MEGSPAKKQKQTQPIAITPPPLKRSYAAVVRNNIDSCCNKENHNCILNPNKLSPTNKKPTMMHPDSVEANLKSHTIEKKPIIVVEHKNNNNRNKRTLKAAEVVGGSDVHPYLRQLEQALELETKYRVEGSNVIGSQINNADSNENINNSSGSITSGMRDGSAHVLRCLKVWYDLPTDVFFNAISSMDRFLARMRAQPKHLACIAVAAFHLACEQHRDLLKEKGEDAILVPDPSDLVSISQSRCSRSDLLRMQDILAKKLEVNPGAGPEPPITSLTMLRLMFNVSRAAALHLGLTELLPESLPDQLLHQLEILSCDSLTLAHRPSEVALALLATCFQHRAAKSPQDSGHSTALMGFISELQKYCNISASNFVSCLGVVVNQLDKYNSECTVAHRQRLVWKLSNRTLRHLRPTDKLRATLPTIRETNPGNVGGGIRLAYSQEDSLECLNDLSSGEDMDIGDEEELSEEVPIDQDI